MRSKLTAMCIVAGCLVSALAFALPRNGKHCPKRSPSQGKSCSRAASCCYYPCEGEGDSGLACACEKGEDGHWRWQCESFGPVCVR
jgi:hypothetical protein